ncbi:tail length tape-measure protein 1 [Salmonella phage S100]|uniref:Tail length tape-measure protein 1 n=2 Tax=Jerseyvirus TaxID=1910991 RepID=A0A2Z5HGZ3_9CAUD|nr:tail length tape-measure protein 1 [Salmonella phage S102]YP_010747626.1 tail length tape-measure protein 1 [Salmonella phage S100]AXC39702.1 tail length tape-measure protein 1 [Salmonella phage S103]AXC39767.1 tail length tape-measure protein [Salmonella phage S104]AXC39833.1 tail length tape-measure protein 1 [Salmonella phage S106]AXC41217.1 tail length tape-measure protein 1 [Salmonella phage S120]AXC41283.1 tail length tape-measure protein 1 [Salmonella phage S123]AXC42112.1 tail len
MADVASLVVKVTEQGAKATSDRLDNLSKSAKVAGAAVTGLAAVVAAMAYKAAQELVESQRQLDKMSASLKTLTGSTQGAKQALSILQDFARDTPYGLEQAVEGFRKLVALGLTPSEEALRSYGNTASAMGKDLNQMIEAVADASTFEFERLKEFGIKAKQNQSDIEFTFQGTTTVVKKNAADIERYLLNIGNVNFAGAMADQANTLNGAIASAEDSWSQLEMTLATGLDVGSLAEPLRYIDDLIQEINAQVASGEFVAEMQMWGDMASDVGGAIEASFDAAFGTVADALNALNSAWTYTSESITGSGEETASTIAESAADALDFIAQEFTAMERFFEDMVKGAQDAGRLVKAALTPGESVAEAKNLNFQLALAMDTQRGVADLTRKSFREQVEAQEDLIALKRAAYDIDKEAAKAEGLGKFKVSGKDSGSTGDSADKAAKKSVDAFERQKKAAEDFYYQSIHLNDDVFQKIQANQEEQLTKLQEFYSNRLLSDQQYETAKTQIMLEADTARQAELDKREKERLEKQFSADAYVAQMQALAEGEFAELDRQYEVKLQKLNDFHAQGLIAEETYQQTLNAMNDTYALDRAKATGTAFGNMASNIGSALGEASTAYKAFAIAQATIATYTSAVEAYKSTAAIPVVGPYLAPVAAAAAVAAGLANVGKIRSAREQGGNLAAGQISTIAERGKPEVIMPASASRVRTAEQMRQIMGENGAKSGGDNVTIVNNTTGRIDSAATERDDEGRLRIIISETVSSALLDSNSAISKSRRATRGQPGY